MTDLPDSLIRFEALLERSAERDLRRHRRRDRRGVVGRLAGASVAVAAIGFGAIAVLGDDRQIAGRSVVAPAAAHERAAAILAPGPGSIVHEVSSTTHEGADGTVSRWHDETWRETAAPYARRQVTVRDGVRTETATVGRRPTELYDATTRTIYTNPPASGPSLGTPMPAADGDPLRAQLLGLLRSADARQVEESSMGQRRVVRFALRDAWPDGSVVRWAYVVDAETYAPIELIASTPDGARTTTRFERYDTLAATDETRGLLSLRAQHPDATVDATELGYQEAMARMSAQPVPPAG